MVNSEGCGRRGLFKTHLEVMTTNKIPVRVASLLDEIQTRELPNTKHNC